MPPAATREDEGVAGLTARPIMFDDEQCFQSGSGQQEAIGAGSRG